MSKDRGHEAILLILDVAAVSPLGGRSTSFLPLSILFFSTRFPSLLDFFFLLLVVSFSSIFFLLSKSFFLNRRRFVEVVLRSIFIFDRSAKLKSGAILYFASNDIVKKVADTHAQIRYAILFITGKRVFLYSQFHIQYSYFGIKNIRDIKTNSNHARIISKIIRRTISRYTCETIPSRRSNNARSGNTDVYI